MIKTVSAITAELADREAIRDCIYRYCRGADRMDAELYMSSFWPEGTDEHGNFNATSAKDFVDKAMKILKTLEGTSHDIGNIIIDIQGDVAHVESYVRTIHRARKPDGVAYDHLSSSRFLDRMERRNGEWRIRSRVVVRDWYREFPDACEWGHGEFHKAMGFQKVPELGKRMPDDRSYEVLWPSHKK